MQLTLNPSSIDDYRTFLAVKRLPSWRIRGRLAEFPDEYAAQLGLAPKTHDATDWTPSDFLFDYQRDIAKLAISKRKFAVFADCGLGKTLIFLEFAQAAMRAMGSGRGVLMVTPAMVVEQTLQECRKFYPYLPAEKIAAKDLQEFLDDCGARFGVTNYEAIKETLTPGKLGGLILDESSMLKSHYGKWGTKLIELGRGLEWKLAGTGTPAPNDRIEYANHSVFLDHFPTVNSFLATYFVNRGQTQERWVLKDHALKPFYRALSHWCIFLSNPATYGWKDNTTNIPPIKVQIHDVPLTDDQRAALQGETGELFVARAGGITKRSKLGQIAKGMHNGNAIGTLKPEFIRKLVNSWSDKESTIVWCIYNHEQDTMEKMFPEAASIRGETPHEKRLTLIDEFKSGERRILISKPKVLGFGLNLQVATRHVFSGIQDSYESYYQAVKRSNRVGSTKPLNVHIPITEVEEPMLANVLRKAAMVQSDTEEQERIFKRCATTY